MPRSVQRDLDGINLALTNDVGFGPSVGAGAFVAPLAFLTDDSRDQNL